MEDILGYIERITYQNPTNGYTVAKLKQKGRKDLTCIVGFMPTVKPGETVRCMGSWKQHLIHGNQFEVEELNQEAPADVVGIEKYLGSGLIKGIGPVYAKKIVKKFKEDTLHIIDKYPDRLLEIPGLGPKKHQIIIDCWHEQRKVRDVMVFLQTHGVSPAYAQKIFRRYRDKSIELIQENPYRLAREVFGIGFKMADDIAQSMGIEKESSKRISSGIEYVFSQLANFGHTCYPYKEFLEKGQEILEVPQERVAEEMEALILAEEVKKIEPYVWSANLYQTEVGSAKLLKKLLDAPSILRSVDGEKAVEWVQKKLEFDLATQQECAVLMSLEKKVSIITGGPGTGKSTITKAILTISERLTNKVLLLAPTGRAAKRMQEITKKPAFTIHAKLEVNFKEGGFKRNQDNPLDADLIIIDEASMIDSQLMYSLLKAIAPHTRVIFVGDVHQLPSVGAGNVLKDLICSRKIPTTRLTEIFRQAQGSQIITNAHNINHGVFPDLTPTSDSDFFFISKDKPEDVLEAILTLVARRLPEKYGLHPTNDIQVLAPMRKGAVGIENLNTMLQQKLNSKAKSSINHHGRVFAEGDKVMQIRNNYQKEVYNGDIGRVVETNESELTVQFDEKIVPYQYSELDEIVLAYAVSIHKFQGSECPCVVIPIHTCHFIMLHRNLLYTGVTRGKKLVILVGQKKALATAVHNEEPLLRHTGLRDAIETQFSTYVPI